MTILFLILILSMCAVLGTTIVMYARVRRQLKASETALHKALHDLEERETTKV
jgi:hypothetical protein